VTLSKPEFSSYAYVQNVEELVTARDNVSSSAVASTKPIAIAYEVLVVRPSNEARSKSESRNTVEKGNFVY
jgi:hypothetical protein